MTETVTTPTSEGTVETTPTTSGAGAPAVEAGSDTPGGSATEAATGADSLPAGAGTDSVGGATEAGGDTTQGSDTAAGTDVLSLESYDFTLPEGFEVNADAMIEFKQLALDSKLQPAAAQKMLDLYASASQAGMTALQTQQAAQFEAQQDAWRTEVAAIPGFRTDAETTKSLSTIGKLLDNPAFCADPDAFRALAATSGVGNNPTFVQTMLNLANALNEGAPSTPGRVVPQPGDRKRGTSLSYPNTPELQH